MADLSGIPKEILKKNEKEGQLKTSKATRRRKFSKFKDTLKNLYGNPTTSVDICLRKCSNRDKKCEDCYRFSNLQEIKE